MWQSVTAEFAEAKAISFNGQEYTYSTLEKDVAVLRGALKENGLVKGDRVALFAPNSYDFVKAFLAIVTSGMCAVILPAHLDEMSVFGCTMIYSAKALVYCPALEEKTNIAKASGKL